MKRPATAHAPGRAVLLSLFGACLAASGVAQMATEVQSQGPFLAAAHGFSMAAGAVGYTGPVDPTEILDKRVGLFVGTSPSIAPAPLPGRPDFRTAAILQGITPRPDIDALSTGLDWVLANDDGEVEIPPGNWGALTFSVTRGTTGRKGGRIRAEVGLPDGAAGDLFSYVLPGSGLPPELVDVTQRAHDSSEFALVPGSVHDMDAHDQFFGLLWLSNPGLAALLPPPLDVPRVFFSVTRSTIGRVPAAWWGAAPPSGAAVFVTEWRGGAWTLPSVFLRPGHLGLGVGDELDAVAIDLAAGEMLFSTTDPARNPILFARGFTLPGLPMPPRLVVRTYREPTSGRSVADRIGLVTVDDVDAICSVDPGGRPPYQFLIGTPEAVRTPPSAPTFLAASLFRAEDPARPGVSRIVATMAGWPPSGRQPGFAGVDLAVFAPIGWFPVPPTTNPQRDPSDPRGGGPEVFEVQVPSQPLPFQAPVWVWWGAIDQPLQTFGFARSVRIHL